MSLTTSIVTTVAGQAYSIEQQRKAQAQAKKAADLEKRRAAIQNARERRKAAAAAQIQRSRLQASQAASQGTSSGFSTGLGAVSSQLASNIGYQQGLEGISKGIISHQQSQSDYLGRAALGQAISSLPSTLGFSPGDIIGNTRKTTGPDVTSNNTPSFFQRNPREGYMSQYFNPGTS